MDWWKRRVMSSNGTIKKWYAIYTKPRWEKKVMRLLEEKGIENYCPLNRVQRKWSDRVKVVEEPLFKSYVFVRVTEDEKTPVRMTGGVVNYVYWQGKPAIIKDREIETIMRFLREYEHVVAEPLPVSENDKIVVTDGVLMDVEGKVLKVMGKKVQVLLECIRYKLVAYVDKQHVKVIKP
jgi:transcription antitermination factor NusG